MLPPNTPAPDFTLADAAGRAVSLSSFRGRIVVLYFYPKDNTHACTAEACAFRDSHEHLTVAGAAVIGISADAPESHAEFAAKNSLPYTLLSDVGGRVAAAYGVRKSLGLIPGRATFVIDKEGVIRHAFSSQLRPAAHVAEARRIVDELAGI